MQLNSIQLTILVVQVTGILLNLNAIFIKKVPDTVNHWVGITILFIIMFLSLKSWYNNSTKEIS